MRQQALFANTQGHPGPDPRHHGCGRRPACSGGCRASAAPPESRACRRSRHAPGWPCCWLRDTTRSASSWRWVWVSPGAGRLRPRRRRSRCAARPSGASSTASGPGRLRTSASGPAAITSATRRRRWQRRGWPAAGAPFAVEPRRLGVDQAVEGRELLRGQALAEVEHGVEGLAAVVGEARALAQPLHAQPVVEQEVGGLAQAHRTSPCGRRRTSPAEVCSGPVTAPRRRLPHPCRHPRTWSRPRAWRRDAGLR